MARNILWGIIAGMILVWLLQPTFGVAVAIYGVLAVAAVGVAANYGVNTAWPALASYLALVFLVLPAPGWVEFWLMALGVAFIATSTLAGRSDYGTSLVGLALLVLVTMFLVANRYPEYPNKVLEQFEAVEYRFGTTTTGSDPGGQQESGKKTEAKTDGGPSDQSTTPQTRTHPGWVTALQKGEWVVARSPDTHFDVTKVAVRDSLYMKYRWGSDGQTGETNLAIGLQERGGTFYGHALQRSAGKIERERFSVRLKPRPRNSNCVVLTLKNAGQVRKREVVRKSSGY
jgi:hypothetical protein